MKAIRAHQFGGPEQLRFEDAPDPQVQAGQVQIRVRAAGINNADMSRLSGLVEEISFPYIPGTDVSGEIEAVGAAVTHLGKGDRIFGRALAGGYAEKTCLAAAEAFELPSNLSFAEGAAIPIPFYTAYNVLHRKGGLKSGETVLISAGGGGVGVAAIQLAKLAGARVVTTVGSQEKAEQVRALGADLAVNYKEQDFVAEINKFTDGKGVDLIIESVAAENLAKDFAALTNKGRIMLIGSGTGKSRDTTFNVLSAVLKDATIYASSLTNVHSEIAEMAKALSDLFAGGKIKAVVSKSYPLSDAVQALSDLRESRVFGKLVLTP
jgi:NADPH:quinone reductase-like Zn-dependent oxidoreductase